LKSARAGGAFVFARELATGPLHAKKRTVRTVGG
jgi:hypothetical protein